VGGVAVALAVADEDDDASAGLVRPHPLALARPAHEAGGWPYGNAIPPPSTSFQFVAMGRSASDRSRRARFEAT